MVNNGKTKCMTDKNSIDLTNLSEKHHLEMKQSIQNAWKININNIFIPYSTMMFANQKTKCVIAKNTNETTIRKEKHHLVFKQSVFKAWKKITNINHKYIIFTPYSTMIFWNTTCRVGINSTRTTIINGNHHVEIKVSVLKAWNIKTTNITYVFPLQY